MFRLFRRRKKEDTKEPVEEKVPTETVVEEKSVIPEVPSIEEKVEEEQVFETKETPFEDKFAQLTHILPETLLEEEPTTPEQKILPFIQNVIEQGSSFADFMSPQIISKESEGELKLREEEYVITRKELPPASLEERIDGALFSVGRPIHADELIESFEEDSPTVKRAIRKLSRKRQRTSAIVVEEISKDRWVMQLNPIFHEFFQPLLPDQFLLPDERRVLTEIAYRQPISLALVKKMVVGMGPLKINEICKKLEEQSFIVSEQRARSLIFTTTPKFASSFGFDNESRRLKLQMLWRLKRLMGDFEAEEEEEGEEELLETQATTETQPESDTIKPPTDGEPHEPELEEEQPQVVEEEPLTDSVDANSTDRMIKEVSEIKADILSEEE